MRVRRNEKGRASERMSKEDTAMKKSRNGKGTRGGERKRKGSVGRRKMKRWERVRINRRGKKGGGEGWPRERKEGRKRG